MSGFEIAGVALGAFPVALEGLKFAIDSMQTLKEWRRYRLKLQDYANMLATAHCFYCDTLDELWSDIVDSEVDLWSLEANPGGPEWQSPLYDRRLKVRLGRSYDSYVQNVVTIHQKLELLCQSLGIEKKAKTQWGDYSGLRRQLMRIKMTVKSNVHKQTLDEIDKANYMVRDITHQSRFLEPLRNGRRGKRLMAEFCAIRDAAASLYDTLIAKERWHCACRERHIVTLRLEQRPSLATSDTSCHSFRLLCAKSYGNVDNSMTLQNLEMQQVDIISSSMVQEAGVAKPVLKKKTVQFATQMTTNNQPPSDKPDLKDLHLINDICRSIQSGNGLDGVAGYLLDSQGQRKHCLSRSMIGGAAGARLQSLSQILGTAQDNREQASFYRADRLRIAVTLASSVLQLTGTPWLNSSWTSENIKLAMNESPECNGNTRDPYLPWTRCIERGKSLPTPLPSLDNDRRNMMLLSLGLTLVELCFGQTLAALQLHEDGDAQLLSTKVSTATRLLRTINREMGDLYSDVVRRCILQPFDVLDIDLNDEMIQQKVYEDIISPLVESLEAFSGQKKLT